MRKGEEWFNDPRWLRKLLGTPIRVNKFKSEKRRQQYIAEETAKRERALFQLYHIPDEWPPLVRWEWLARHLAGERFAGCRVIEKGQGGMRKVRRLQIDEQRAPLFAQFERYVSNYHVAHPHWTRNKVTVAGKFMEENKQACAEAGLNSPRSFLKALKRRKNLTLQLSPTDTVLRKPDK